MERRKVNLSLREEIDKATSYSSSYLCLLLTALVDLWKSIWMIAQSRDLVCGSYVQIANLNLQLTCCLLILYVEDKQKVN